MPRLTVQEIKNRAREVIHTTPGGIRFANLVKTIYDENPETSRNTIHGSIWNLDAQFPSEIAKPSRGLFTSLRTGGQEIPATAVEVSEDDFYQSFSEWLKDDLDEVVSSAPLGGKSLGQKWGTPDVVGVYRPTSSQLVKFQPEIVTAEIKIDPYQSVVAFGQAISYRLFSTKTYIVMPNTIPIEDFSRLESLAILFGIGLVLFKLNPNDPEYELRVRAQRFIPDMFYVNEFADQLKRIDIDKFESLFG